MKAILIKKGLPRESKYGGKVVRCHFRSIEPDDGKVYMLDVYNGHSKSARFFATGLPEQGIYSNLSVLKRYGGKFIDGTCDFTFEGVKTQK